MTGAGMLDHWGASRCVQELLCGRKHVQGLLCGRKSVQGLLCGRKYVQGREEYFSNVQISA